MTVTIDSASAAVKPVAGPPSGGGFDLDVRIVESGPAAAVLLGDTDDGCDTEKEGDC